MTSFETLISDLKRSHGPMTMLFVLAELYKTQPTEDELRCFSEIILEKTKTPEFKVFIKFEDSLFVE